MDNVLSNGFCELKENELRSIEGGSIRGIIYAIADTIRKITKPVRVWC